MHNGASSAHLKKVRVVFCGGCNPGYDRVAAAGVIRRELSEDGGFVVIDGEVPDIVVAVCGCVCACIDDKAFGNARIVRITGEDAARDIAAVLKAVVTASVMPGRDLTSVMPNPGAASVMPDSDPASS